MKSKMKIKMKIAGKLWGLSAILLFVSCAKGFDDNETFSGGVTNTQLESAGFQLYIGYYYPSAVVVELVGNPYLCNSRFGSSLFQPAPGFLHAQNEE